MSWVTVKAPNAPAPLACMRRSGITSRSKLRQLFQKPDVLQQRRAARPGRLDVDVVADRRAGRVRQMGTSRCVDHGGLHQLDVMRRGGACFSRKIGDQPRQGDSRITLQKFPRRKCGSFSARTSAFTLPKVVSGLCLMPS